MNKKVIIFPDSGFLVCFLSKKINYTAFLAKFIDNTIAKTV